MAFQVRVVHLGIPVTALLKLALLFLYHHAKFQRLQLLSSTRFVRTVLLQRRCCIVSEERIAKHVMLA